MDCRWAPFGRCDGPGPSLVDDNVPRAVEQAGNVVGRIEAFWRWWARYKPHIRRMVTDD